MKAWKDELTYLGKPPFVLQSCPTLLTGDQ
jgi:hypothetical protein